MRESERKLRPWLTRQLVPTQIVVEHLNGDAQRLVEAVQALQKYPPEQRR